MTTIPAYRSGVYLTNPRVYQSTRDNVIGQDITRYITELETDADIDRAGSKHSMSLVSLSADAVPTSSWVAPMVEVVPEVGDPVRTQRGLFQLGQHSIEYDEAGRQVVQVDGEDPVAIFERAVLTEPQYTPKGAVVMEEVRRAVEMATLTYTTGNLIPNGSFTDGLTGWSAVGNHGTYTTQLDDNKTIDEGKVFRQTWSANPHPDTYGALRTTTNVILPAGTSQVTVEAWVTVTHISLEPYIWVSWWDAQGNHLANTLKAHEPLVSSGVWVRLMFTVEVPQGAYQFRPEFHTRLMVPGTVGNVRWDGLKMWFSRGTPFFRHAFPDDLRYTTTPIAHRPGTTWLQRINDLLKAIGYHAMTSTPDGYLTSRPIRDPQSDTPTKTLRGRGDSEIIDGPRIEQNAGNIYNVVVAVKEDHQAGTYMYAEARNDDPTHPWSTRNRGDISPREPLTVAEAVDQDALQAIADEKLARASMQESISLTTLPDHRLTVYDVIEFTDTDGPEAGRWAIESLRWGIVGDSLLRIGARRTYTVTNPGS